MTVTELAQKYKEMLALKAEISIMNANLAQLEEPFRKAVSEIAFESGELVSADVIFKENEVHFSCHGTGIYSHEEWFEHFPVEELLERASKGKQ